MNVIAYPSIVILNEIHLKSLRKRSKNTFLVYPSRRVRRKNVLFWHKRRSILQVSPHRFDNDRFGNDSFFFSSKRYSRSSPLRCIVKMVTSAMPRKLIIERAIYTLLLILCVLSRRKESLGHSVRVHAISGLGT